MPSLFLVHCGYYDRDAFEGVFESHADLFVVADDFNDAKARIKRHPEFSRRKMHVDGMIRIDAVDGYRLTLDEDESLGGATRTERTRASWRSLNAGTKPTSG